MNHTLVDKLLNWIYPNRNNKVLEQNERLLREQQHEQEQWERLAWEQHRRLIETRWRLRHK